MHRRTRLGFVLLALILLPRIAAAQASIAGVVKDTSGAVLPGVTVEASSPALIERVRSVITDSTGQYRIIDLRPGTYAVTFSLPGFTTVKREGIELTGSFTAAINVEMRVGSVEETLTVTGATPIVDVQNTTAERVIDHAVIDNIPTGRLYNNLAVLIPGIVIQQQVGTSGMGPQDVGGTTGDQLNKFTIHGNRASEQRVTLNGLPTGLPDNQAESAYTPNSTATQEIVIDTGAISVESTGGGVRINLVPRDGGNAFHGTVFGSYANDRFASSNITPDLRQLGFLRANTVKVNGDFNPGLGGPIRRDRLWFYGSARYLKTVNWAAGMWVDTTANDPNIWTFNPDFSKPVSNALLYEDEHARVTWQVNGQHKIAVGYIHQTQCKCPVSYSSTRAMPQWNPWGFNGTTVDWTGVMTPRLLLEGALFAHGMHRTLGGIMPGANPSLIPVTEQSIGLLYKGQQTPNPGRDRTITDYYRAAMSYVTGAHAFKIGFTNGFGRRETENFLHDNNNSAIYRFNNGVPNLITLLARPYNDLWRLDADLGVFVQDKWTIERLTLTGGARFDYYKSHFPGQHLGPVTLVPNRDITIARTPQKNWKDITPRFGVAYDLFGNGRTAVKASLNKYLYAEYDSASVANPIGSLVVQTTRTWNDENRDYVPNCDLTNPAANGECAQMANTNFGKAVPATVWDPRLLNGFGNRGFNWEFSGGVQQELSHGMAVTATYFRRWYGNLWATDNRALSAADFDPYCVPVPVDARLPGGGGTQLCGLYNLNPSRFGVPADNYVTFAENYGSEYEHWNGFDAALNSQVTDRLRLQGGLSSGRTSIDNCEVAKALPESLTTATNAAPLSYCHVDTPFLTQLKALGAYTIPHVDVQISGTWQSLPGPQLAANYNVPNAVAAASLGRSLSGGASNVTVNVLPSLSSFSITGGATGGTFGTTYGERLNQLDLRVGKRFNFGARRVSVNVDVYNLTNNNAVIQENTVYGATWRQPQLILPARFAKFTAQMDF